MSYVTQPRKAVGCASLPAFMPPGERACVESLAFAFRVLFFPTVFSEMVTGRNLRAMMPGFRVGQWQRATERDCVRRDPGWRAGPIGLISNRSLFARRARSRLVSRSPAARPTGRGALRLQLRDRRVRKWHRRAPHQDGPGCRPAGMARNHAIDDKLQCSRGW